MRKQFRKITQSLKKITDKNPRRQTIIPAVLGNHSGTVLTGVEGIVYATRMNGEVMQVVNRRVPNVPFRNVIIGYDDIEPGILQVLYSRDVYGKNDTYPHVPDHSQTHEYAGGDTLFPSIDQIKPFLILPYDGFTVQLFGGIFIKGDKTIGVVDNQTIDLSASQPSTGARYTLIEYDDDGTVSVTDGSTVATKEALAFSDIPTVTENPLCAVRLYAEQAGISRDPNGLYDFADPRLGYSGIPASISVKWIDFDTSPGALATQEGRVFWAAGEYTLSLDTGLGPVLQVGQELFTPVYNNTGAQIDNATAVEPTGAFGGNPTVREAFCDTHLGFAGIVLVTTMDIPDSSLGVAATIMGKVRGVNTDSFNLGDVLWLAPSGSGILNNLTNVRPDLPNYQVQIGGVAVKDASVGVIQLAIEADYHNTLQNFWNGTFREGFDFRITSDGATITGSLTPSSSSHDDLTMLFSDGFTILDTSPAATVELTAGTDTIPQLNYIYIPQSTKVLTVSTAGWPTAEHIKVATAVCQTAATVQVEGALKNHNWNDHNADVDSGQGHLAHLGAAIREKTDATWKSGTEATMTVDATPTPDSVTIAVTAGVVRQMHNQSFQNFEMVQYSIDAVSQGSKTFTISGDGDLTTTFTVGRLMQVHNSTGNDRFYTVASVLWSDPDFIITVEEAIPDATADGTIGDDVVIVNDPATAYKHTIDINTITDDSEGSTINNKWFSIVLWGIANKTGEVSHLMVNLPSGSYLTEVNAINDADNYSNYTIPAYYKGTGFLIARFTLKKATNVWTYNGGTAYEDLRGKVPNTTAGGGGGGGGAAATSYLALTDTPSAFTNKAGQYSRVASGETALEFALPVIQRVMSADYILLDGESLVITGYLDIGTNELELQGDSDMEIL